MLNNSLGHNLPVVVGVEGRTTQLASEVFWCTAWKPAFPCRLDRAPAEEDDEAVAPNKVRIIFFGEESFEDVKETALKPFLPHFAKL